MAGHPELALHILRLFAKGELSGSQVQGIAHAAFADGWGRDNELAAGLARAGSSGTCSGNIVRDIMRIATNSGLMSSSTKPYTFSLVKGRGVVDVFLPHEVYPQMVQTTSLDQWCLSNSDLESDCGIGALLKQWAVRDGVNVHGDLSQVAAFGIHCDGVSYTTSMRAGGSKSVLAASFNVISSPLDRGKNRRQPLFVVRKARLCDCGCSGFCSLQEIFAVVSWSMQCLANGLSPSCRHDGAAWTREDLLNRIESGIQIPKAALLQIRGDWEWIEMCFRVRSVNSDKFCWMCDATKSRGPHYFHEFTSAAGHRATSISHQQYILACASEGTSPSTIIRSPGFVMDYLAVDSMHAADLGCFQDALGSLFFLEIDNKMWYPSRAVGLVELNKKLNQYYTANNHRQFSRVTPLTIQQILGKEPGYPYLKAKAAQTRHLADFGLVLANSHLHGSPGKQPFRFGQAHRLAEHTPDHLGHLVRLFEGMTQYHNACAAQPFSIAACREGMYKFLQSLEHLHVLWRTGCVLDEHRVQPFNVRPKAHMLQHMVEDKLALWGSPNLFWCYRDEDYVGAIKTMAAKTKHPATLERRVSEKLMLLAGLNSRV